MILEVYKYTKNDAVKEYYVYALNRNNADNICYYGFTIKQVVELYKTKGFRFTKEDADIDNFELVSSKEYNSIEEIEFEYIEYLI